MEYAGSRVPGRGLGKNIFRVREKHTTLASEMWGATLTLVNQAQPNVPMPKSSGVAVCSHWFILHSKANFVTGMIVLIELYE
jgi:hypothetical protein